MIHDKTEYCESGALTKNSKFRKSSRLVMNISISNIIYKLSIHLQYCATQETN